MFMFPRTLFFPFKPLRTRSPSPSYASSPYCPALVSTVTVRNCNDAITLQVVMNKILGVIPTRSRAAMAWTPLARPRDCRWIWSAAGVSAGQCGEKERADIG